MQNECLNLQERRQRSKGLLTVKYHSPQLISFIATVNNISTELKISPIILQNTWTMLRALELASHDYQSGTLLLKSPCVVRVWPINPCHASGELHSMARGSALHRWKSMGTFWCWKKVRFEW